MFSCIYLRFADKFVYVYLSENILDSFLATVDTRKLIINFIENFLPFIFPFITFLIFMLDYILTLKRENKSNFTKP